MPRKTAPAPTVEPPVTGELPQSPKPKAAPKPPGRNLVELLHASHEVKIARTAAQIREEAIALFERELDARIANLQDGEQLLITFRVDIRGLNGRIRGGRYSSRNMPEYALWRKAVYTRDNYMCRECGAKGRIVAHHIQHWAKHPGLRFDVDNGVTLCEACHTKKHPHLGVGRHGADRKTNQTDA